MKAETLKKSILQYAMQGKLVSQDPNDEPASELLKRIKDEKERLIKDGKIKKEKPLPPITGDEITFELPKGWVWVRFAECLDVRDGTHNSPKYQKSGYPFITSKNLNNGKLDFSNVQYISEDDFLKFSTHSYVENEDILFAMIGSIGNPVIVKKDREFSIKNVALFKKSDFISVKYLYNYLLYLQDILKNNATGAVQSFVSLSALRLSLLALPPLAEQQRIADKLEQILPLIEEYGKNEEKLSKLNKILPDKIKQSILQHAIQGKLVPQNPADEPASKLLEQIKAEKEQLIKDGKIKKEKPLPPVTQEEIPYELPQGWKIARLGDILLFENGDRSKNYPTQNDYTENGIPFWGAKDIYNNKLTITPELRYISPAKYNSLRSGKLKDNDFIILLRGSVGKWATFNKTEFFDTGFINAQMVIMRLITSLMLNYFKIYLESPLFQMQIKNKTTGSAVTQMSAKDLSEFVIFIPPLTEQQRIIEKVEELLSIVNELKL